MGEVANDHGIERSRVAFTRPGTCVCKISKPAPEGYCSKCRRELPSAKSKLIDDLGSDESLIKSGSMNEQSKDDADSQSGWYPDPVTGELKYFDGKNWLDIPPPGSKSQSSRRAPREQEEVYVEENKSKKRNLNFALLFGIALVVIFVGTQVRGTSTTQPPASSDTSGEGRWISKCRTVLVPNPNYPGDQAPISERIGIPRNFSQQQCTDVYVKD